MQFSLSIVSSSFLMMNFSSVAVIVSRIYDISEFAVNSCVMVFLITFIFVNFPSIWAMEKNIKTTFVLSAGGTVVGAWLRYLVVKHDASFNWLIVAQSLIGATQPFIYNGSSKIATSWFGDQERAVATAIGSLALPVGAIVGLVMGPFYIFEDDEIDKVSGRQHV